MQRQCLPAGGQVVQTGSDVIAVEVHLLAVEGALLLQAAQGVAKSLKLRPPALATQTLLPDVLEGFREEMRLDGWVM